MRLNRIPSSLLTLLILAGQAIAQPSLKQEFKGRFLVGAALHPGQFISGSAERRALIVEQFNSITPENVMKWEVIHPAKDRYDFSQSDRFVDFGKSHKMFIVGHTLVWHQQTPRWVFEDAEGKPLDRDTLLARMKEHISTVVGHYKGRVKGWDVVNEALNQDGSLRASPWLKIIGEEYLVKAFEYAHAADPRAELYYNDYGIEDPAKRNGAVTLLKKLQAAGAHVTGVGVQEHATLSWPSVQGVDDTLTAFGNLGLKVMITELDIDLLPARSQDHGAEVSRREAEDPKLNPYPEGLPDEVQRALARRYGDLFAVYLKHAGVLTRVTLWGVTDADSWLNYWPIHGRTSHPLLFDRHGDPKPAFAAVIEAAELAKRR